VFENRVLRRIFGPKRDEVIGGWRKLHNEELHKFYFTPDIIRIIKSMKIIWAGHVARIGQKRNAYRIYMRKSEGNRPLGRPRDRIIIKFILEKYDGGGMNWINLAQYRDQWRGIVNTRMDIQVP
jgi:hypothetical protein